MGKKLMSEDAEYITLYLDKKEEKPTLEECQKFVGGYIEIVESLDRKKQIIVDEEGLLKSKPINKDASKEAGIPIVGDAMVLSGRARVN